MKYDTPELGDQLAAEYVLGTMPTLVRRRFERLLATYPELARAVEDWTVRLGPIDEMAETQEPPPHIWRAVERRLALPPAPRPAAAAAGWLGSLAVWRSATLAAAAVAAVAIIYIAVRMPSAPVTVVAILGDDKGDPGWIALGGASAGDIAVASIRQVAVDTAHTFELWAIADGKPHPLGLLTPKPGNPLWVPASRVPEKGVLAVSLEPAGGSPTGLPTGPVRYHGEVLPRTP
ncbi:MAG TPA: anti-sigma factor [Stellaceae bacterium]|nr:anti-sigma factor [Stellaceae bacterium]